ncbi:MAG: SDR family oxidoreductase [Micropruina sp.]|nr:SDR family oxidoreductase [Micropruina sp.]
MEFEGRVCVIAGGASGIGAEIAGQFGARGADVAIVDIQLEKAEAVAEQVTADGPGSASAFACDIRSVEQIESAVAAIRTHYGRIDVLVNSTGLANRTPNESITEAEWDLLNDVNLKGPFFMAQQVYRVMLEQKSGKIINIASYMAHIADGRHLIYAATKAGLQAVTRDLAVAGARHGIEVNTISPGYVLTPLTAHNLENEGWLERLQARVPLGRLIDTGEIANAVLFLASPSTGGITGQNLLVDGGRTIQD